MGSVSVSFFVLYLKFLGIMAIIGPSDQNNHAFFIFRIYRYVNDL